MKQQFSPLVLIIAIFYTSAVFGQEDYSKWSHSQRILFNTSNASGSDISGNLFSFPVLIRLNRGNFRFFSQIKDNGADIRFAKPDSTHLPYQIERWDDNAENNDTAEIWVRVDTLFGNSVTQNIVIFWGNSSAKDSSNSEMVFDTNNHFNGTWHMNESTGALIDATNNGYDAARNGNMTQATGEIGYGQTLDGSGDYADMGNVLNPGTSNLTITAWLKLSTIDTWQTIITKTSGGDPSSTYGWHFCLSSNNNAIFYIASDGSSWGDAGTYKHTASGSISDLSTWHHVAVVVDRSANSACKIFIDGIDSSGTTQGSITSLGTVSNSVDARIGSESDGDYQFNGHLDEITIASTARSDNWIKLCYENQKPSQTLVTTSGRLWWDNDASSGIQADNGSWGTDAYWSHSKTEGRALNTWPGSGYTAAFGGSNGNYTVTVSETQLVDSIIFEASTYTLTEGTISFGSVPGVIMLTNTEVSATIASKIDGSAGLTLYGNEGTGSDQNTLHLSGENVYTGVTTLTSHICCKVDTFTDGGKSSPLGASASDAVNLVLDDAVLLYTGGTTSTDRLFTVTTNGASLYSSGSGALFFTNDGAIEFSGSGKHTLEFGGDYVDGRNTFAPLIQDGTGGTTSVTKTGAGNTWIFTGTNTYTGATTIKGGSLIVNGTIGAESDVTVEDGATIGGNGAISGSIDAAGTIEPGSNGTGKLQTGSLTLSSTSILNFELGTTSDSLVVEGDLTLDGTLNITATTGFSTGTYRLVSWSGTLTNNELTIGTLPANGTLQLTNSTLSIVFADTPDIKITSQPQSQIVTIGDSTGFTVAAAGDMLAYEWKKVGSNSSLSSENTFSIKSVSFSDSARYYCVVSNSAMSINTDTVSLTVVSEDMENPLTVTAQRLESTDVQVTISGLDKIDTAAPEPEADSIGLWIMAGSLPESTEEATLFKTYDRSRITGTVLLDTLTLPESNSVYGIMTGLFWDNSTVSPFLSGNGTLVDLRDTPTVVDSSIIGCISITDLYFDSLCASLRLSWCVDTKKYDGDLDVGITYSLTQFPTEMSGNQTVMKLTTCTDTCVQLNEPLLFDTLYYVNIFIRKPGNSWIAGGDSARDTVRTGRIFRQVVTYFNSDVTNDSVSVFNGQVLLWKDSTLNNTLVLTDTIEVYQPDLPEGFIVAGTPVSFLKAFSGPRLFIGFRVNVPDNYTIADVHIFRDSAGVMLVEYASITDSAAGIIYVSTTNIEQPFIPMIDTRPMEVSFKTDISTVASPDQDLFDLAEIADNVANVRWWYLYSKADEHPMVRDSGTFQDTSNFCNLQIPTSSWVINSYYGLRAIFVVSDGSFTDTFDLSRQVYREDSDQLVTTSNKWRPIYPTAELDETDPDTLIVAAISKDKTYDTRYLRLFRWVGVEANRNEEEKWVEYNPEETSIRSLFTLEPGRLLWLKTRENVLISFGNAKTLSLKDTFSIKLPPKDFTDFGMPYRFDITIKDILESSGNESEEIYFLSWNTDKVTGQYKCEIVYSANLPGYTDTSIPLNFTEGCGYSFYNPLQDTVILRIPPTLATTDETQQLSKKSTVKNWCARLVATEENGYTFPVLNCGYAAGLSKCSYPVPPSFNNVNLYFYDRDDDIKQAHYLTDSATKGVVKELRFANNSDSVARISFRFETAGPFPREYTAHLFDNSTKVFLSEGTVDVPAKTTVSRWLTVGNEEFRSRFLTSATKYTCSLRRIYPNPAHRIVNISYSVPIDLENQLHISIFDLRGRKIWDKRITRLLPAGNHIITWDGKNSGSAVGAGMYLIRMSVVTPKGKTVQSFERSITYLP